MNLKEKFDQIRVTDYDRIGIDPPHLFWIRLLGDTIVSAMEPIVKAFKELMPVIIDFADSIKRLDLA